MMIAGNLAAATPSDLANEVRVNMLAKLDEIARAGGGSYRLVPSSGGAPNVTTFEGVKVLHYPSTVWTTWHSQWTSLMQISGAFGQPFPLGDGTSAATRIKEVMAAVGNLPPDKWAYQASMIALIGYLKSLPTIDGARQQARSTINKLYPSLPKMSYVGPAVAALAAVAGLGYAIYKLLGSPSADSVAHTIRAMPD